MRRTVWMGMLVTAFVVVGCTNDGAPAAGRVEATTGSATATGPSSTTPIGIATETELGAPEDLAFDEAGNLYVSEWDGARVDRISPSGDLSVVVGTGTPGAPRQGTSAVVSPIQRPTGIAFDPNGLLTVAAFEDNVILQVSEDDTLEVIAGTGEDASGGDGANALHADIEHPSGIAFDAMGRLVIAEQQGGHLREVDVDRTITTIAGGGSTSDLGLSGRARPGSIALGYPQYVVVAPDGRLLFTDFGSNEILQIDGAGRLSRFAGTGVPGFSGDGGPAIDAELRFPTGLAIDGDGNVYVSDANNNRVRMIDAHGDISTIAGTRRAGTEGLGGPAVEASLSGPAGLVIGPDGLLYIADQGNDRVVRIDADGTLELVAGR